MVYGVKQALLWSCCKLGGLFSPFLVAHGRK